MMNVSVSAAAILVKNPGQFHAYMVSHSYGIRKGAVAALEAPTIQTIIVRTLSLSCVDDANLGFHACVTKRGASPRRPAALKRDDVSDVEVVLAAISSVYTWTINYPD